MNSSVSSSPSLKPLSLLVAFSLLLASSAFASAKKEIVLHDFSTQAEGLRPQFGLVRDSSGNLYGTTEAFGGVVFELSPAGSGGWNYSVLYTFADCTAGCYPQGALALDSAGNLYGATSSGGANGAGAVFELTRTSGAWSYAALYSFGATGSGDGNQANGVVYFNGGLYGTTIFGGQYNSGTVFSVTPNQNGAWSESVLHSFKGSPYDGANPYGGVTLDVAGNIYGTTYSGGPRVSREYGIVFELAPANDGSGTWNETTLLNFDGNNGSNPWFMTMIFDKKGNLFGTASESVFELSRSGKKWTETTLHRFTAYRDGFQPQGGVTMDSQGVLYGTTIEGGGKGLCQNLPNPQNLFCGTVYQLVASGGAWTENILYSFSDSSDGGYPLGTLVLDEKYHLYGVTSSGGSGALQSGVLFELSLR